MIDHFQHVPLSPLDRVYARGALESIRSMVGKRIKNVLLEQARIDETDYWSVHLAHGEDQRPLLARRLRGYSEMLGWLDDEDRWRQAQWLALEATNEPGLRQHVLMAMVQTAIQEMKAGRDPQKILHAMRGMLSGDGLQALRQKLMNPQGTHDMALQVWGEQWMAPWGNAPWREIKTPRASYAITNGHTVLYGAKARERMAAQNAKGNGQQAAGGQKGGGSQYTPSQQKSREEKAGVARQHLDTLKGQFKPQGSTPAVDKARQGGSGQPPAAFGTLNDQQMDELARNLPYLDIEELENSVGPWMTASFPSTKPEMIAAIFKEAKEIAAAPTVPEAGAIPITVGGPKASPRSVGGGSAPVQPTAPSNAGTPPVQDEAGLPEAIPVKNPPPTPSAPTQPADPLHAKHVKMVVDHIAENLKKDPNLTGAQKREFVKAAHQAFSKMSPHALTNAMKNVKKMSFHPTHQKLAEVLGARNAKIRQMAAAGEEVVAAFDRETGELHLNGGGSSKSTHEAYTHALTHALDGDIKTGLSASQTWKEAFQQDFAGGKFTKHAQKNPREAFAEFGRLAFSGKATKEELKKLAPNAYKFFADKGLIPNDMPGKGPMAPPTEVFSDSTNEGMDADAVSKTAPVPTPTPQPAAGATGQTGSPAPTPQPKPPVPAPQPKPTAQPSPTPTTQPAPKTSDRAAAANKFASEVGGNDPAAVAAAKQEYDARYDKQEQAYMKAHAKDANGKPVDQMAKVWDTEALDVAKAHLNHISKTKANDPAAYRRFLAEVSILESLNAKYHSPQPTQPTSQKPTLTPAASPAGSPSPTPTPQQTAQPKPPAPTQPPKQPSANDPVEVEKGAPAYHKPTITTEKTPSGGRIETRRFRGNESVKEYDANGNVVSDKTGNYLHAGEDFEGGAENLKKKLESVKDSLNNPATPAWAKPERMKYIADAEALLAGKTAAPTQPAPQTPAAPQPTTQPAPQQPATTSQKIAMPTPTPMDDAALNKKWEDVANGPADNELTKITAISSLYRKIRQAKYSAAPEQDQKSFNNAVNQKNRVNGVAPAPQEGEYASSWTFRNPPHKDKMGPEVDRLHLNVKPSQKLIEALDSFIADPANGAYYKVPFDGLSFLGRHDPAVIYFDKSVTPEQTAKLNKLMEPHIRDDFNDDSLVGLKVGKGIAKVPEPTRQDVIDMLSRAKKISPQLHKDMVNYLESPFGLDNKRSGKSSPRISSGSLEAMNRLVDKFDPQGAAHRKAELERQTKEWASQGAVSGQSPPTVTPQPPTKPSTPVSPSNPWDGVPARVQAQEAAKAQQVPISTPIDEPVKQEPAPQPNGDVDYHKAVKNFSPEDQAKLAASVGHIPQGLDEKSKPHPLRVVKQTQPFSSYEEASSLPGWKMHLASKNPQAVAAELKKMGLFHKVGKSSGQEGKDLTVYIGSKDLADKYAQEINDKMGHLLDEPHGDALKTGTSFGGKVVGRFDAADDRANFHQYGRNGISDLLQDHYTTNWGEKPTPEALKARTEKAHKALEWKYGEHYTGTKKPEAAQEPAPQPEPVAVQTETPIDDTPVVDPISPQEASDLSPSESMVDASGEEEPQPVDPAQASAASPSEEMVSIPDDETGAETPVAESPTQVPAQEPVSAQSAKPLAAPQAPTPETPGQKAAADEHAVNPTKASLLLERAKKKLADPNLPPDRKAFLQDYADKMESLVNAPLSEEGTSEAEHSWDESKGWDDNGYPVGFAKASQLTPQNTRNEAVPESAAPKLSYREASALRGQTGTKYGRVNEALRDGRSDHDEHVKAVQDAMRKAKPLDKPIQVKRGLEIEDGLNDFLRSINESKASGKPLTLPGFQSTTTDAKVKDNFAGNIQFDIEAVHGLDARPYAKHPDENEFLLDHNSQFEVLGIDQKDGKHIVKLKQILPAHLKGQDAPGEVPSLQSQPEPIAASGTPAGQAGSVDAPGVEASQPGPDSAIQADQPGAGEALPQQSPSVTPPEDGQAIHDRVMADPDPVTAASKLTPGQQHDLKQYLFRENLVDGYKDEWGKVDGVVAKKAGQTPATSEQPATKSGNVSTSAIEPAIDSATSPAIDAAPAPPVAPEAPEAVPPPVKPKRERKPKVAKAPVPSPVPTNAPTPVTPTAAPSPAQAASPAGNADQEVKEVSTPPVTAAPTPASTPTVKATDGTDVQTQWDHTKDYVPESMQQQIKQAFDHQSMFVEHSGGLIPIPRLYHEMKKRVPDMELKDLHQALEQMNSNYQVELHVLNETKQAVEPELAMTKKGPDGDSRLRYYVMWKPPGTKALNGVVGEDGTIKSDKPAPQAAAPSSPPPDASPEVEFHGPGMGATTPPAPAPVSRLDKLRNAQQAAPAPQAKPTVAAKPAPVSAKPLPPMTQRLPSGRLKLQEDHPNFDDVRDHDEGVDENFVPAPLDPKATPEENIAQIAARVKAGYKGMLVSEIGRKAKKATVEDLEGLTKKESKSDKRKREKEEARQAELSKQAKVEEEIAVTSKTKAADDLLAKGDARAQLKKTREQIHKEIGDSLKKKNQGLTVETLQRATGKTPEEISVALERLKAEGKIEEVKNAQGSSWWVTMGGTQNMSLLSVYDELLDLLGVA